MKDTRAQRQGMAASDATAISPDGEHGAEGSLRSRKKARRREEIRDHARRLFGERGVDATAMAEIAEAAGVSTPTVFNYFGNKDGILIAIIAEGAQKARETSNVLEPRTDVTFLETVMTVFTDISVETMNIASKRIWRYANAAAMRHPTTGLAMSFRQVDDALLDLITVILSRYDLTLHSGATGDPRAIAHLFYDVWTQTFHGFIRDAGMTVDAHCAELEARFAPLCDMIFSPGFLARPALVRSPNEQG
ncbi:TetR/AcrR family transcriptional regulator [Pseudooceanicola sp.]|uniref:TetR/AcrR family transcriptional regulator n=1 Tax=Pseudooceanicola sp. TaxID=1914328 RepID=UPI0035144544